MRHFLKGEKFDIKIEPSDWRYSAAIVGIYKYFMFCTLEEGEDFIITDEAIEFNEDVVTEEKFLAFAEDYYDQFPHKEIESILKNAVISEEQLKIANALQNGIIKKVFGNRKIDKENKNEFLELIEDNRMLIIKETFRNKKDMYVNFANSNQLFTEEGDSCRLWGYYVDGNKKSKAISYKFDSNTFVFKDDRYFDFIPFAFVGGMETLFINDSFSVKILINTNNHFQEHLFNSLSDDKDNRIDVLKLLFKAIQEASDFLDYDVEIIVKKRENKFYETMFLRKESIDVIKSIKVYQPFCIYKKVTDQYYRNVLEEVLSCIVNMIRTDQIIEFLLKDKSKFNYQYVVYLLIKINVLICGGGIRMNGAMYAAKKCAEKTVASLQKKGNKNKIDSYRQKLLSSIIFRDYNRFCEVILQLSSYSDVTYDFVYDLFENFEENKDVAYTFVNALAVVNVEDK